MAGCENIIGTKTLIPHDGGNNAHHRIGCGDEFRIGFIAEVVVPPSQGKNAEFCVCVCVCDFVGCNMCIMKSHESISPSCAQNNWKFIAGATFQTKSPMATTTLVKEQIQNGVFG